MEPTENGATATIDDVASSVANLTQAVEDMKNGQVDRSTVEAMVRDAVEHANQTRTGYVPDAVDQDGNQIDVERALGTSPATRMNAILTLPARQTASILRTDVETVENFREKSDDLLLLTTMLRGLGSQMSPTDTRFYADEFLPAMQAAVSTTGAGTGAEFVPRDLSSQLIERINLELRVLDLFPSIPMPTNPFDLPARGLVRQRGARGDEATADSGQTAVKKVTPGSRKVTLEAVKFWAETLVSKEAQEDQLIAVLPFIREELVDFVAADMEDTVINGDTTVTHRDSDTTATDDPRKNWDGIRKLAKANSAERDHSGATLTVAGLRSNRKLMGKYGIRPGELAHIIGLSAYIGLLSDTNVLTVDKYGSNATIITGELAKADGVPVIVSEFVREDLDATGVYDSTPGTKSIAATVNKRGLLRGSRRGLTVEYLKELYSEYDQDAVKISRRDALTERFAGEKTVAVSYNVGN